MLRPSKIDRCALVAFLVTAALFLGGWYFFQQNGLYREVVSISECRFEDRGKDTREDAERLLSGLKKRGIHVDLQAVGSFDAVREMVRSVGHLVSRVERPTQPIDLSRALNSSSSEIGLICGGMSGLLDEMLDAYGFKTRVVQLFRDLGSPFDTHVVIEVWFEGSWIVLDPTYNVTYEVDGQPLGVEQIRDRMRAGTAEEVEPVAGGDRLYPARLSDLKSDWRTYFNNAYVYEKCPDCSVLSRIPPFRYWNGPRICLFGEENFLFTETHNAFYFTVVVVLPLLAFLAVLGLIRSLLIRTESG